MKYIQNLLVVLGFLFVSLAVTAGVIGINHLRADHAAYHSSLEPYDRNFQVLELLRLEILKQHPEIADESE